MAILAILLFLFGALVGLQLGIWLPRRLVLWCRRWYYSLGQKLWVRFGDETTE